MENILPVDPEAARRRPQDWRLKPVYDYRAIILVALVTIALAFSASRLSLDAALADIGAFFLAAIGVTETSSIGEGVSSFVDGMFPPTIDESRPVDLMEPEEVARALKNPMARLELKVVEETVLDPESFEMITRDVERSFLVEKGGYLKYVLQKMFETFELAVWSTLLAVLVSLPLSLVCARNFVPFEIISSSARAIVSFLRSIPELISALFLVLAFGFGPVAGILALTIHSTGFLARFFADEVEGSDRSAHDAIMATGAGWFAVLRLAVIPHVLPAFIGLGLYILDRNVRMATVIGLVGAGGIGQELKGRYDMFQYDRVATILIVIFLAVALLDIIAARIRRNLL